jgi:hypothetical protein
MNAKAIQKRAKLIRATTPDILEELWEMQNRKCDLCGQFIQDLVLAALDHSIPIIVFARSPLPIEEAIKQANDPVNLRATHTFCNKSKGSMTRDEWFAKGMDGKVGEPEIWTEKEIGELREKMHKIAVKNGRRGGYKGGAITAKNKTGVCGRTPEQMSIDGRKGGNIQGPRNVQNGQIRTLGIEMARIGHLANIASLGGQAAINSGQIQALGKEQGQKNSDTGFIQKLGSKQGRENVRSGHLARLRTPEHQQKASHIYWHVRRGVVNPKCPSCIGDQW